VFIRIFDEPFVNSVDPVVCNWGRWLRVLWSYFITVADIFAEGCATRRKQHGYGKCGLQPPAVLGAVEGYLFLHVESL
jgi:hypothetical protein